MVCLIITNHNSWSKEVVLFIYWTYEHNQCYVWSKLPQPILIMGSHYTGVKGTISNLHLCNFCLDNDTRTEIYNCYKNIATNMFWQKFDNKYRSNTAEQPFHSAWLNLEYPILARLAVIKAVGVTSIGGYAYNSDCLDHRAKTNYCIAPVTDTTSTVLVCFLFCSSSCCCSVCVCWLGWW